MFVSYFPIMTLTGLGAQFVCAVRMLCFTCVEPHANLG